MVENINPRANKGLSVFAKIVSLLVATTLITAAFIMVASKVVTDKAVREGIYNLGQNVTFSVASRSGGAIRFGDAEKLNKDLEMVIASSEGQALHGLAVNGDGEVVASWGSATEAQLADLTAIAQASAQTGAPETTGDGSFAAAPATTKSGSVVGSVAMLWSSDAARTAVFRDQLMAYGFAGFAFFVMLGFSYFFMRRIISRPLDDLNHTIDTLAAGVYDQEGKHLSRGDEIGRISRNVEHLREELAKAADLSKEREEAQIQQGHVVTTLTKALKKMSDGDLTASIQDGFPAEYEPLRRNFNSTHATIVSIIDAVIESSDRIRSSAEEISQSSGDLAQRTESQAATLEETAAAMELLNANVRTAADGAREVESIMSETRETAETSGQVVTDTVDAMSKIEDSTQRITKILGVIDEIAFQTNLLALNAGVEAARAGEAGRGFAVVATEVRALALRSSDAAQEIKQLIEESTGHVEEGVQLVGRTGEELEKIISRVGTISGQVSEIANGSQEQASTLGEISVGVSQLDGVTQHNAAMVEETTAASQVLRNDAHQLTRIVSVFKTLASEKSSTVQLAPEPEISVASQATDEEASAAPTETVDVKAAVGWDDF